MNIILTGAAGHLGTDVSQQLIERGHAVIGTDVKPARNPKHEVIVGSLTEPFFFHRVLDNMPDADAIIHLANIPHPYSAEPQRILRENLSINTNVFMPALDRNIPRVIYASSIQAWSQSQDHASNHPVDHAHIDRLPIDESHPTNPNNTYGLSKRLAEHMLDSLCTKHFREPPLTAASLRFPAIVPDDFFLRAAPRRIAEPKPELPSQLSEGLSYIARSDAAYLCVAAAETPTPNHQIFWAVTPEPRSFHHSTSDLIDHYIPNIPGADRAKQLNSLFDSSKAQQTFNWTPKRLFADFIKTHQAEASA